MQAQLLTYKCPHCGQPTDVDASQAEHTLTCPNPLCRKPFKLEVASAEPLPKLVISPGLAHEVVQENQPVQADAAAQQAEAEADLLTVHPQTFRRYPFRTVAYGLLAVVGLAFLLTSLIKGGWFLGTLGLLMVAFGLFKLMVLWLHMVSTAVTVTTKRTLLRSGAFHSQLTEIPHSTVADLEVHQTLINRLMGVGDMALVTKAEDKRGILLMAMPHPEDIAQQIRMRRQV